jgi:hypothetical protein
MRSPPASAPRPRRTFPTPQRVRHLHQLCALLAAVDGQRPRTDPIEWTGVTALARRLLLVPALWCAVARAGLIDEVPEPVAARLRQAHRQNIARNAMFRAQLETAVQALNQAGIRPVLFKGSLYLFDGTFLDAGERTQWDLDLAVSPEELTSAVTALNAIGYRPKPTRPFATPHELPLRADHQLGDLELHSSLGSPPIPDVLPMDMARMTGTPLEAGSARALGLCPTDSVIHNVLHAQLQDLNHACGGIAVRQLHTLTRLTQAHAERIDWPRVWHAFEAHRLTGVLQAYLHQAETLLRASVPPGPQSRRPAAAHHLFCLACWELGWPTDVLRNLRFAFGREYLSATYDRPDPGGWLIRLRAAHALQLLHSRGRTVLRDATVRRV